MTTHLADISAANNVMHDYIVPTMLMLGGLATIVCTFFIVMSGYQYMTSRGAPDKLEHAKRVLKNALIGLVIVLAAGTLTAVLSNAYGNTSPTGVENIPALETIEQPEEDLSIVDVLIKAIIGLFKHIIESAASPFLKALDYFTHETPLMAQNASVFKLWLTSVIIADALFVLVVALLGFHVMSAASLGFDELELKHLIPQLVFTFLFINTSIFFIDLVIALSNVLIKAIEAAFSSISVWDVLGKVADGAGSMGLVALIIMVGFIILSVLLLVYYVMRLVALYIGAVLAPLVGLLAILPGFKDFAITAAKTYLTTIFVLFVHVIILQLAASLFGSIATDEAPNALMAVIVGIATLLALLKTQGMMMQMTYVAAGPRALRKLGGQFMNGVSYTADKIKTVRTVNVKPAASDLKGGTK
ncbi:hypothetical protein KC867_03225 [Candidatus Saccharibacteria bacterium]|nr:hypothetical protein [Candidatus Saccharibacteria bacterium]